MKIEKQRNLIWDIIPPQISRPAIQQKYFFAGIQIGAQCTSALLIGLLIFTPIFPVFAEEVVEFSEEVSGTDIISQTAAVEDEAPILPEVGSTEEKLASTTEETEESLLNDAEASTTVQDTLDESVGLAEADDSESETEEIIGTSTTEVIEESVMKDNEITENTDVIAESESGTEMSPEIVEDLRPASTTEENLLEENLVNELVEDASTTVQDTLDESAELAEAVIEEEITGTSTTEIETEIVEEAVEENSYAIENTDAIIEFKSETATNLIATSFAEQNLFAGKECIFLNNGNDFYCFKSNKESNASTSIENLGAIEKGKVASIRDSDGDREISLYINGKATQITDNNRDDLFPAQDITGSSIVWQSLVNERWQIMFYDQGAATTTQITDSDFNNMMPQIYGDVVVWQGWPRDNWEIFYAKKNNNGEWIIKQVTNNDYPDMFPKVMGNNITWQAFKDGGWHIFTYDIKGDAITKISATGIKNENPKFMIIWEEKGDGTATRTFGYDFFSGEVVALNNNEKPQEIPEPPLKNDIALSISTTTPNKLENEESD